jgi:hypothetical protein
MDMDGSNTITVTHIDTAAYYEFNKPIHESYGDFRIIRKANNDQRSTSYLVKLDDPVSLLEQYSGNLHLDADDADGWLTLSIVAGNPAKGVAFLNKVLQLYKNDHYSGSRFASNSYTARLHEPITILERPENNIELASMHPFWVYTLALLAGLAIPFGRIGIKYARREQLSPGALGLPKLVTRIHHRFAIRQMD